MKSFWDELRIIPRMAWPLALLPAMGVTALFLRMPRTVPLDRIGIAFAVWGGLFFFFYVIVVVYIHMDARRRGMRYVMWTLLTIFIPYFIGAILYFVLRDPPLVPCPKCGARGRSIYVYCPKCGAELVPSCPGCKRAVEPGWNLCAYCGRELEQPAGDPAIQIS